MILSTVRFIKKGNYKWYRNLFGRPFSKHSERVAIFSEQKKYLFDIPPPRPSPKQNHSRWKLLINCVSDAVGSSVFFKRRLLHGSLNGKHVKKTHFLDLFQVIVFFYPLLNHNEITISVNTFGSIFSSMFNARLKIQLLVELPPISHPDIPSMNRGKGSQGSPFHPRMGNP